MYIKAVILSLSSQAPYLLHIEVVECEDTYLSPLPVKQLDVSVQSAGLNSSLAGVCVRSEGASPSSMRAASLPCLTVTEMAAGVQVSGVRSTIIGSHRDIYTHSLCTGVNFYPLLLNANVYVLRIHPCKLEDSFEGNELPLVELKSMCT